MVLNNNPLRKAYKMITPPIPQRKPSQFSRLANSAAGAIGSAFGGPVGGIAGQAIGSLIGGLGGGGGLDRGAIFDQYKLQQRHEVNMFHEKMNLAQKYKIHPLTMVGAQLPQASSPVYSGKDNSMGQNIAKSIGQGVSQAFTGKSLRTMNALQLERAQLENELLKTQITSINRPQAGELQSTNNVLTLPSEQEAQNPNKPGYAAADRSPATKTFDIGIDATTGKRLTIDLPTAQTIGEAMEQLPGGVSHSKWAEYQSKLKKTKKTDAVRKLLHETNSKRMDKIKKRTDKLKSQNAPWWKY